MLGLRFREFVALMIVRLYWLGVIEAERGANYPHFFKVDLTPPIWRFLCSDEGGRVGELMNGADCSYTPHSASLVCVNSSFVTGCGKHVILAACNATYH